MKMNESKTIACRFNGRQSLPIGKDRCFKTNSGEIKQDSLGQCIAPKEIGTYEKNHPYLWSFADCEWSLFGTLTWASKGRRADKFNAEIMRHSDFIGLISAACVNLRIKRKHLPYYHVMEWSAIDECHYHFLIAKDARQKVPENVLADFLENYWTNEFLLTQKSLTKGAGDAMVRPYEQAQGLRGVSYCLKRNSKRDFDAYGNRRERFDYLSPSLMALLQKKITPEPRLPLLYS